MAEKKVFSGYLVALGATLVLFVHNGIMGTLGLFLPEFAAALNASVTAVSLGLTVSSIVAFLISLFVGSLMVKFSPKYMLLAASLTCCIQCIIYGTATSVNHIYLAAVVEGITTGIGTTVCISAIIKLWFVEKREAIIGYVIGGAMIGSALYNLFAGTVIFNFGWRNAYYALAATTVVLAIPANLILIKKSPESVGQKALGWEKEAELAAQLSVGEGNLGISAKQALKTPSFWLVLVLGGLFAGMSMGFVTYAPTFWQDLGMDAFTSSRYFTIFSLLSVFATMLSGKVAEKFGNKFFILYLHIAFILGLLAAIFGGISSVAMILLSIVGAAIGFACYTTMLPTITTEIFGSRDYERITGYFMAANYVGLCLVSPIIGTIRDKSGSFIIAFWLLIVMALLSMFAIFVAIQLAPMKKYLKGIRMEPKED